MFADVIRENFRAIVTEYRRATRTSLTQVSKRFYGNAGFLEQFFAGTQSCSIKKMDEMIESIQAEWPVNARWPYVRPLVLPAPGKISPQKSAD